ncbi:MAG: 2OG-Fe(II) oxygenase [Myxococcota bacterium]
MKLLDLDALDAAPLQHDPCDFVVVPRFVRADALAAVNADYPAIEEPGNFEPSGLRFGPTFETLLAELHDPVLREHFGAKFGLDLSPYPLDMTVRRYSHISDGNVHNDSKGKIVTSLIYFNPTWDHEGGRLRLVRNPDDIEDYAAEVVPEAGTLISFRRSEHSYHGFLPVEAERRSLQMYWVKPKRYEKEEKKMTLKRRWKRWRKERARD